MNEQSQDYLLEPTYCSSMQIRDVTLKTCRKQWTTRHDDEDDDEDLGCSEIFYLYFVWKNEYFFDQMISFIVNTDETQLQIRLIIT